jgi:hypothetical protein
VEVPALGKGESPGHPRLSSLLSARGALPSQFPLRLDCGKHDMRPREELCDGGRRVREAPRMQDCRFRGPADDDDGRCASISSTVMVSVAVSWADASSVIWDIGVSLSREVGFRARLVCPHLPGRLLVAGSMHRVGRGARSGERRF